MRNKRRMIVLLVIVLMQVLAACGGNGLRRPTATPALCRTNCLTNPTIVVEAAETMAAWAAGKADK